MKPKLGPWIASAALLALLSLICSVSLLGRGMLFYARKGINCWTEWRLLPPEERRLRSLDTTYAVLLYIRDNTPPHSVILLPPSKFISEQAKQEIPLLASSSAVYSFIYPRIPVHWGEPSPFKNRIDFVLVWEHWGLSLVQPGAPETAENRIHLYRARNLGPAPW